MVGGLIAVVVLAATGQFSTSAVTVTIAPPRLLVPSFSECTQPPCVNVGNACPFPLWLQRDETEPQLLLPGTARSEEAWQQSGRLQAYYQDPTVQPQAFDAVDVVVTDDRQRLTVRSRSDEYVALPWSLTSTGPLSLEELRASCPSELWDENTQRCLSAGTFCLDPLHTDHPLCHRLDATLEQCVAQPELYPDCDQAAGHTTTDVYAGRGYFDGSTATSRQWRAALNRNMLSAPQATDPSLFYQGTAFNPYDRWLHQHQLKTMEQSTPMERVNLLWCPPPHPKT